MLFRKSVVQKLIERETKRISEYLKNNEINTKEYHEAIKRLHELVLIRKEQQQIGISKDTVIKGGITILSLLLILNYEKLDVISTKGFGLFIKQV